VSVFDSDHGLKNGSSVCAQGFDCANDFAGPPCCFCFELTVMVNIEAHGRHLCGDVTRSTLEETDSMACTRCWSLKVLII
jgi:hypothetical protein